MSNEQERGESPREHTEAMEHWGETPRPEGAQERSEELAARAGLPSEADRRDRWVGVQDEADAGEPSTGERPAASRP